MIDPDFADTILFQAVAPLSEDNDRDDAIRQALQIVADNVPHYKWIGVYWLSDGVLVLGPYVGAATDHTAIPVGKGVCGTAVAEDRNIIVQDVRAVENYLACSIETRSEIVVLIRDSLTREILGQVDVDGHTVGAFDKSDEAFLMDIAAFITERIEYDE